MTSRTVDELITITQAALLRDGGVDNWEWYGESLENYEPSDDPHKDAESFLNALSVGGVDNWEWYGESLEGLSEYEEYLEELTALSEAKGFYAWKNAPQAEVEAVEVPIVEPEEAQPKANINGDTEQKLYLHLEDKFREHPTAELFTAIKEAGIWKYNCFEVEFKLAIKEAQKSEEDMLEVARAKLFELIVKRKKLDPFIQKVITS